jgi:predicted nucleic acid-binding protein
VIFVDTGAFLARHLVKDQFHERAVDGWVELSRHRCVTTIHVIDETITLLARRAGHAFAAERARAILTSRVLQVERPGLDDELAALEQFERFGDQAISFTDALSFAVMRRMRIERAFSFDRHFALAGFELWPR